MVAMAAARTVSDITLKGLIVKRFNHNEIRYLWLPFSYGKVLYLSPELPMCLCRKKPAFYIINHISFFFSRYIYYLYFKNENTEMQRDHNTHPVTNNSLMLELLF